LAVSRSLFAGLRCLSTLSFQAGTQSTWKTPSRGT